MVRYISLLLFIGLAWGQPKTVAVFDFSNNGLSINEVRTLTDRLRTELVQLEKFNVVERSKIDEILSEQKFQMSGCVDECLIEVGKLLGATSVVIGSIGKVGNTFTVSARIVNATTGEIEKAISYDSQYNIDELLTLGMRNVVRKLIGKEEDSKPLYWNPNTTWKNNTGYQVITKTTFFNKSSSGQRDAIKRLFIKENISLKAKRKHQSMYKNNIF